MASLLAGRLADAEEGALRLAGQGVRDTTRIAASAPELWVQILGANAGPVVEILDALAGDLADVAAALRERALPVPGVSSRRRSVRGTTASTVFPESTDRTSASSRSSS